MTDDEKQAGAPGSTKDKFREALERKRGHQAERAAEGEAHAGSKIHGEPARSPVRRQQPRPIGRGCWFCSVLQSSDGADVRGLRALLALRGLELHTLVVFEALVAIADDRGEVDEDVGCAAVGCDEAEALFAVEPLHGSLGHALSLLAVTVEPAHGVPTRVVRKCLSHKVKKDDMRCKLLRVVT
jgi:hypothetical protein